MSDSKIHCQNCKFFDTEESEYHQPNTTWCCHPKLSEKNCEKAEISWAWINICKGNLFQPKEELRMNLMAQAVLNLYEVRIESKQVLFWKHPVIGSPQYDFVLPIECFDKEVLTALDNYQKDK